jgi:GrpB-like predicted nucleotidyltransferase (UPF0157 family)
MSPTDQYEQWQEQAKQECERLLAILGEIVKGGMVENIQHVGATSVAGLPARPCVDLALAVVPFPVEGDAQAALEALDYRASSAQTSKLEQCFEHVTGAFRLYVTEAGSDEWMNHLLLRDYLRHDEDARRRYSAQKSLSSAMDARSLEEVKAKDSLFVGLLADAKRWWVNHHGWGPVEFVVQELEGFDPPWYISSGWAIDLFLGQVTRVHHDVDVVVARDDQLALREQLTQRGWDFVTPLKGKLEPWPAHMRLELPRHQFHAHRQGAFIDFLLTDITQGIWHYRRNPVVIRRIEQAGLRTSRGIPYLAPELVLLFKSKNTGNRERSQDQVDYEKVYPYLQPEARAWLLWALTATDPTHPWIEQLASAAS